MFVLVTVFCIWLAYELNWRRERKLFLEQSHVSHDFEDSNPFSDTDPPRTFDAPWRLRIFGERGVARVTLLFDSDQPRAISIAEAAQKLEAQKLFPEAKVQAVAHPYGRPD
jgi:hypothetical protein